MSIYSEQDLVKLEEEEHAITEEALVSLFILLLMYRDGIKNELIRFYNEYGKDGIVTYSEARKWISTTNHQRRLTGLFLFISTSFTDLLNGMKPKFDDMIMDVIEKEYEFFDVGELIPNDLKIKWGTDNLTWSERLEENIKVWETRLVDDIKRSILMRKNIDDVLDIIDKRFLTMKNITRRLAITETTAVGSIARKAAFKELGITKYRFYAREDERTCEQCGSMHGLIFPISAYEPGVTASPLHSNCRCMERPIRD